jgi:hypothetical protein
MSSPGCSLRGSRQFGLLKPQPVLQSSDTISDTKFIARWATRLATKP